MENIYYDHDNVDNSDELFNSFLDKFGCKFFDKNDLYVLRHLYENNNPILLAAFAIYEHDNSIIDNEENDHLNEFIDTLQRVLSSLHTNSDIFIMRTDIVTAYLNQLLTNTQRKYLIYLCDSLDNNLIKIYNEYKEEEEKDNSNATNWLYKVIELNIHRQWYNTLNQKQQHLITYLSELNQNKKITTTQYLKLEYSIYKDNCNSLYKSYDEYLNKLSEKEFLISLKHITHHIYDVYNIQQEYKIQAKLAINLLYETYELNKIEKKYLMSCINQQDHRLYALFSLYEIDHDVDMLFNELSKLSQQWKNELYQNNTQIISFINYIDQLDELPYDCLVMIYELLYIQHDDLLDLIETFYNFNDDDQLNDQLDEEFEFEGNDQTDDDEEIELAHITIGEKSAFINSIKRQEEEEGEEPKQPQHIKDIIFEQIKLQHFGKM